MVIFIHISVHEYSIKEKTGSLLLVESVQYLSIPEALTECRESVFWNVILCSMHSNSNKELIPFDYVAVQAPHLWDHSQLDTQK